MKRSDLYKKLRDISKSKLPDLAYVDLQKGQFKRIAENYPIPMPALLFEFSDFDFSNVLNNGQIGSATVSACLYLDLVTDSFDTCELENESLELMDRADEIFNALQGESCELFSKLIRKREAKPEYGTRYIMLRTEFTCSVKDIKKTVTVTVSKPTIEINTANG